MAVLIKIMDLVRADRVVAQGPDPPQGDPAMTILALDLGKIKSVGCIYQTGTREHTYQTVRTSPQTLHDLIVGLNPQRVNVGLKA